MEALHNQYFCITLQNSNLLLREISKIISEINSVHSYDYTWQYFTGVLFFP